MSLPHILNLILVFLAIIAASSWGTLIILWRKKFDIKVNNVLPEIKFPEFPVQEPCQFTKQEFKGDPCKWVEPPLNLRPPPEPCKFEKCEHESPTMTVSSFPFVEEKFPTFKPPKVLINHQIIKSDGTHVGWRHATHADIDEALKTPGLAVKYPDGTIDKGVQ